MRKNIYRDKRYYYFPITETSLETIVETPIEDAGIEKAIADFDLQQILKRLTPKQKRVAKLLINGYVLKEICKIEKISYYSLKDRIGGIRKKLIFRES